MEKFLFHPRLPASDRNFVMESAMYIAFLSLFFSCAVFSVLATFGAPFAVVVGGSVGATAGLIYQTMRRYGRLSSKNSLILGACGVGFSVPVGLPLFYLFGPFVGMGLILCTCRVFSEGPEHPAEPKR